MADKIEVAPELRVLLYDIETSPNLGYVWGKYEQNILGDFVQERQIISFAWKWLGEKEVQVVRVDNKLNNFGIVKILWALMDRADVVVAHNGMAFDDKLSYTEFVLHGLKPPARHKSVDTLKVVKKFFKFNSNKLNDLGKRLGLGEKVQTGGFQLWVGCLKNDPAAWKKMMEYNKQDVVLLEKVYHRILPWITNHPQWKQNKKTKEWKVR